MRHIRPRITLAMSLLVVACMAGCQRSEESISMLPEQNKASLQDTAIIESPDTICNITAKVGNRLPDKRVRAIKGDALRIETEGMSLTALGGAVKHGGVYSVTALTEHEMPPMPQGMVNMTATTAGYRLLPSGDHFDPPAELRVQYDPSLLPPGYTPDDIYTSFFDSTSMSWVRLERIGIDTAAREIVSLTAHFTDFVNELLKAPEMPETQAFVPTAMTDLEAVNPLEGLPIMQPPTANQEGTANLSYPIEIPAGRGGMQPSLSLNYSSGGGNGWLGVGWDISVPSISLDTRWGVPRYSATKETEIYLLNGEQLVTRDGDGNLRPMPHRTNQQTDRITGDTRFYARTGDAHDSIIRHGITPHDYWWEVTDRTGITHYYGHYPTQGMDATIPSTLSAPGGVARWMLCESRDPHGNWVRYYYDTVMTGGLNPGVQIYLDSIVYTGHENERGHNCVYFERKERDMKDRPSSCNLGFKEETDQRLCLVASKLDDTVVTAYYFETECRYESNFKTRLTAVSKIGGLSAVGAGGLEKDPCRDGLSIVNGNYTRQEFTYFDAPPISEMFGDTVISRPRKDGVRGFMLTPDFWLENVNSATALGLSHSKNWSIGGALCVGLGPIVCKSSTSVGGNYHRGKGSSESLMTLVDLDGDALADKVYVDDGSMYWCRQISGANGRIQFAAPILVDGPGRFLVESNGSNTVGVQAEVAGIASGSGAWTWSKSTTSTFFADVDGDGLVDIVDNGSAYFNSVVDGEPTFTLYQSRASSGDGQTAVDPPLKTSSGCGGIIFDGSVNDSVVYRWVWKLCELSGVFDSAIVFQYCEDYEDNDYFIARPLLQSDGYHIAHYCHVLDSSQRNLANWGVPRTEAVRVWVAPDSGQVTLSSFVRLVEEDSERRRLSRHADGVTYTIQHSRGITVVGDTLHNAIGGNSILMARHICPDCYATGSITDFSIFDTILHFRVDSGDVIFFRLRPNDDMQFDNVQDYASIYFGGQQYNSWEHFVLTEDNYFQAPFDGEYTIEGDFTHDYADVELKIKHYGIGQNTFTGNNVHFELTDNIDKDSIIRLDVRHTGGGALDWGSVSLRARITFTALDSDSLPDPIYVWTPGKKHIEHPSNCIWGNNSYRCLFGPLAGGWGQFSYHPVGPGPHDIIRPGSLVPSRQRTPESQEEADDIEEQVNDTICDTCFNQPSLDDFTHLYGSQFNVIGDSSCWVPMKADAEHGRWVAFGAQNSIGRDTMSGCIQDWWYTSESQVADTASVGLPYGVELDDPIPAPSDSQTPVKAVAKATRSFNQSYNVGALGIDASYSHGRNDMSIDYMDLNGDRYPDNVGSDYVQYRSQWGGLGHVKRLSGWMRDSVISVTNSVGFGFGAIPVYHRRVIATTPAKSKYTIEGDGHVSSSYSGGWNRSSGSWTDINGDGLPDWVTEDSLVRINTGYGFLDAENWHFDGILSGQSVSASANASGNIGANCLPWLGELIHNGSSWLNGVLKKISVCQGSIQAGRGLGLSLNRTGRTFMDINGDGLPDQVWRRPLDINISWDSLLSPMDYVHVKFNLGGGQWSDIYNLDFKNFNWSESYNESLDAGATVGFTVFGVKATVGLNGTPYGGSVSRDRMQLVDIDADGLPELVTSGGENELTVRRNLAGKTNLLRKVTNFTGSKIYLDYSLSEPCYEQPSRTWQLTQVSTKDTMNAVGGDSTVTRFAYSSPHYDRLERTSYGYGTVVIEQVDPSTNNVYRKVLREQHNSNILMKGKPKREATCDGNGNMYIEKLYDYTYSTPSGNAVDTCSPDAWEKIRGMVTRHYDSLGHKKMTTVETYEYDRFHNIVKYTDGGDTAYSDDGLYVVMEYLGGQQSNLIGLRSEYRVYATGDSASNWMRRSGSEYYMHGKEKKRKFYTLSDISVYDFEYDTYGNLTKAVQPENDSSQRMMYTYTYDSKLHTYPVKIRNSFGDSTVTSYSLVLGKPVSVTDPSGSAMHYSYDPAGCLVSVTSPLCTGNAHSLENSYYVAGYYVDGLHAEFSYSDRPFAITKHFDDSGTPITMTVAIADGFGRIIQTKKGITVGGQQKLQVSGRVETDPFGRTVRQYDPFTESITTQSGDFSINAGSALASETEYDILDRTVTVRQPLNTVTSMLYDVRNDRYGRRRFFTRTTDPNGHATDRYSDHDGRQVQVTDADGGITYMTYNALGQLRSSTDPDGYETTYEYDRLGRMTEREHPDAGVTQYTYDLAGNIIHESNPLGDIFYDYRYNRLAKKRYSAMAENDVEYTYGTNSLGRGRPVRIEDGTGFRELEYDAMGNVIGELRTVEIPYSHSRNLFRTQYTYDSWGRMQTMTYPDGEVLTYTYGYGGDLISMSGEKGAESHEYVISITYNDFGQRSRIEYENGTYATYHYDALHRLDSLCSFTGTEPSIPMQRIKYSFDGVGNITQVRNHALPIGTLGGQYTNQHWYDALNQLVKSCTMPGAVNLAGTYSLDMKYSQSGRLSNKQVEAAGTTSTNKDFSFGYCEEMRPHAPVRISQETESLLTDLQWDVSGNLGQVNTFLGGEYNDSRFLFWTVDDRLHTVSDSKCHSYYAYDYSGERIIKMTGDNTLLDVNADVMMTTAKLNNITIYPSPYIVITNTGYTKHYYVGSDRLCARIGGGALVVAEEESTGISTDLFESCLDDAKNRALDANVPECVSSIYGGDDSYLQQYLGGIPSALNAEVTVDHYDFFSTLSYYQNNNGSEEEAYFYHGDHLGGANWITDANGEPVQHLQYLPFGEQFVNQHTSGYQERFTFTSKERDVETGYSYFGARYMDHELMTMWLSVDPMADKYPSISPYAYCSWKPIILVDPDGQKDRPFRLGDKHVLKIPGTETRIYTNKIGLMQVYSPYSILNAYNCHSFAWHGSWGDKNPASGDIPYPTSSQKIFF